MKGSIDKKNHSLVQKADLKFPGSQDDGHEVSVSAKAEDQEITCALAPKKLLSGEGKTEFEFGLKNITKAGEEGVEVSANCMAGGYNIAGVYPYSALNFSATRAKADGEVECEMIWSENFKFDKFHVGFENEFD